MPCRTFLFVTLFVFAVSTAQAAGLWAFNMPADAAGLAIRGLVWAPCAAPPQEIDERRPAGRIANVAHHPVATLAPSVRQVMAAYRFGITGEAARQFGSVAGHHANSRALALCCVEAVDRAWDITQSQMRNITLGATYSSHRPTVGLKNRA